jgi:hypothetical protein
MQHKLRRINAGLSLIREKWPEATPLEIYVAFDLANCCVDELIEQLDSPAFRVEIEVELSARLSTGKSAAIMTRTIGESDESDGEDRDTEFMSRAAPPPQKKRWSQKDQDLSKIEPCPATVAPEVWVTWSPVHRRSYLRRKCDENGYLYRNPPVGVERKFGPWTAEEKAAFLARLAETRKDQTTVDGKWGLFSLALPGRVGYQCSNFYRLLIMAGEVEDSRYSIGEDGKLHHLSHSKKWGMPTPPKKQPEPVKSRYEQWAEMNPMPDANDPLTGEKMRVPTMSPDGYVFDYNSWIKTRKSDCVNPYTRDIVKKRDLIVLTTENFDQFKDKIRQINP